MDPMPPLTNVGIRGYKDVTLKGKSACELHTRLEQEAPVCPCCGGDRLHSKGKYTRRVRHLPILGKQSTLVVQTHRYQCRDCGRSFIPELPGIKPWRRSSEPLREQLYEAHEDGICAKRLAQRERMGEATIARIYEQFTARKASERLSLDCPRVLGIDEHTIHKGGKFATTFCDLKNHRVFDIFEGRSESDMRSFLARLKGREQVQVVCIDLSSPYRYLIRRWFPKARIVADRFHVVRIVIQHFLALCRQIAPEIKHQRGYLNALRKRVDRLKQRDHLRLQVLFERHPSLKALWEMKNKLCSLMCQKEQNKRQCRGLSQLLLGYIAELKQCGLEAMVTLAKTLKAWAEEIACMWRFRKNNGITEGFHRKMKLIQRRAYGFRNFNNYRLRVIAQCG